MYVFSVPTIYATRHWKAIENSDFIGDVYRLGQNTKPYIFCPYLCQIMTDFQFLADRTNGRAYATVLRLSSSVVCDVMYWLNGAS